MNHNSNFDERFNAELDNRFDRQPDNSLSGLTPDELSVAEPLLNLAQNLHQVPVPTLSATSKARIEEVLHRQVLMQPSPSIRNRGFTRWQFIAASFVLLLGLGSFLVMWTAKQKNDEIQVTTIQQATVEPLVSPLETEQSSTAVPTENNEIGSSTPVASQINEPPISAVVVCENSSSYWQDNLQSWPINSLTLGDRNYIQTDLVALLDTPVGNDASLVLAQALIIAHLNGRSVADLANAHALLEDYTGSLPFEVDIASPIGRTMLDATNNLQAITMDCVTPTPSTNANGNANNANNGNSSPDTCKNPPPDHANAQGWRDRCENGDSTNNGNNGNGNKK